MSEICAVLLVPEEGDPLGLLAEGPCGARPPVAECLSDPDWSTGEWEAGHRDNWRAVADEWPDQYRRALVLAWERKPVWQGMAQAHSVSMRDVTGSQSWPSFVSVVHVVRWAEVYAAEGLGTLVLLDADGRVLGGEE